VILLIFHSPYELNRRSGLIAILSDACADGLLISAVQTVVTELHVDIASGIRNLTTIVGPIALMILHLTALPAAHHRTDGGRIINDGAGPTI
jgi:hypothetical protein